MMVNCMVYLGDKDSSPVNIRYVVAAITYSLNFTVFDITRFMGLRPNS